MTNAKEELLKKAGNHSILWARVYYTDWDGADDDVPETQFLLSPDHTKEELDQFLDTLDFDYNNGYGIDYIHGTVMLDNGMWLERREYDGSEWWEVNQVPQW